MQKEDANNLLDYLYMWKNLGTNRGTHICTFSEWVHLALESRVPMLYLTKMFLELLLYLHDRVWILVMRMLLQLREK